MVTQFESKVYELCSQVPEGKVTTYKEIGDALGIGGYRAVGNALNKNPFAPKVPCHRVVSSTGKLGGFAHGPERKIEILAKEGVQVSEGKILEFATRLHRFDRKAYK